MMILESYMNLNENMIIQNINSINLKDQILQENFKDNAKRIINKIKEGVKKFFTVIINKIKNVLSRIGKFTKNINTFTIFKDYNSIVNDSKKGNYNGDKGVRACFDIKKIDRAFGNKESGFVLYTYKKLPDMCNSLNNITNTLNLVIQDSNKELVNIITNYNNKKKYTDDNPEIIDVDLNDSTNLLSESEATARNINYSSGEKFELSCENIKKYFKIDIDSKYQYNIIAMREYLMSEINDSAEVKFIEHNVINKYYKVNSAKNNNNGNARDQLKMTDVCEATFKKIESIVNSSEKEFKKKLDEFEKNIEDRTNTSLRDFQRTIANTLTSINNIYQFADMCNKYLLLFIFNQGEVIGKNIKGAKNLF